MKLELPDGSDPLRTLAPVKDGSPLYWKVTNRGKRGISLDVRTAQGRELLLRLLPQFDVLVENFRTGTLDRWGLDIGTLRAANPRLIVLRLTGFGQTGPAATRPGFARIFEAMSGFTNLAGTADSGPLHMNYPVGDVIAGLFGAFSIATAIAEQRSGRDAPVREIDLAATEAMFRLLDPLAVEYEQLGHARQRAGNRTTYAAPSNMYRTADDVWVTVVASSDATFARLAQAMGEPGLAARASTPAMSNACGTSTGSTPSWQRGSRSATMRRPARRWSGMACRSARSSASKISWQIRTCAPGRRSRGCRTRSSAHCPRRASCRGFPDMLRRHLALAPQSASTTRRSMATWGSAPRNSKRCGKQA